MARLIDLHAIMVDPSEDYRGLLGHFSSDPMDRIVDPFQIAGQSAPLKSIINPLWAELLLRVEARWYGLESFPSLHVLAYVPRQLHGTL